MLYECKVCNQVSYIKRELLQKHLKEVHQLELVEYYEKYNKESLFICDECGEKCVSKKSLSSHRKDVHNILKPCEIAALKNESRERTIKCEECGEMFSKYNELSVHLKKKHNMTAIEYYKKYLMKPTDFENCKECGKPNNFRFDRGFNDFCCFSCSTTWYAKNTNRVEMAQETMKKRKEEDPDFHLSTSSVRYWILKGFSEEEAKQKVTERQRTFTKEKLIEKLGEEEGIKRWKERQKKWQDNFKKQNFSQISQELFWKVYEEIKHLPLDVYFAEKDGTNIDKSGKNHEYKVETVESYCRLDFYIPQINLCIEFDGDYWHGEARGNLERDLIREESIREKNPKIIFIHVPEKEYKLDKQEKVEELAKYIKEQYKEIIENAFRSP